MRITAVLLLMAACSAEPGPEPAQQADRVGATGAGTPVKQSRGAIPRVRSATDTEAAAAKIMAGGFLPDGSFVHGDHIHKPGQENCPSEMNGGPVQ